MDSRERVIRTLTFDKPDRTPIDVWILPAGWKKHGKPLRDEYNRADVDILVSPIPDPAVSAEQYNVGIYIDGWGCEWHNLREGMVGEVKVSPLEDIGKLKTYRAPTELIDALGAIPECMDFRKNHPGKFICGGWLTVFERMQFLRGTENLLMDIALDEKEIYLLRDIVLDYNMKYLKYILNYDIDAVMFGDDWGSQINSLISPAQWKKIFKPAYEEMFHLVKQSGKYVFFHSDGHILSLYDELLTLPIDAINSQIWCMGIDNVAKYKGKITFWGEVSRQQTLPYGTPADVTDACMQMKEKLTVDGAGLIGQAELDVMTPMENIKAFFGAWR